MKIIRCTDPNDMFVFGQEDKEAAWHFARTNPPCGHKKHLVVIGELGISKALTDRTEECAKVAEDANLEGCCESCTVSAKLGIASKIRNLKNKTDSLEQDHG